MRDHEVIGATQMLPYPMAFFGRDANAAHLSEVCTHPGFSNKLVMREPIYPAEPWLLNYYAG